MNTLKKLSVLTAALSMAGALSAMDGNGKRPNPNPEDHAGLAEQNKLLRDQLEQQRQQFEQQRQQFEQQRQILALLMAERTQHASGASSSAASSSSAAASSSAPSAPRSTTGAAAAATAGSTQHATLFRQMASNIDSTVQDGIAQINAPQGVVLSTVNAVGQTVNGATGSFLDGVYWAFDRYSQVSQAQGSVSRLFRLDTLLTDIVDPEKKDKKDASGKK